MKKSATPAARNAYRKAREIAKAERGIEAYEAQFKNRNDGVYNGLMRASEEMKRLAAEAFLQRRDEIANDRRKSAESLAQMALRVRIDGERILAEAVKSLRDHARRAS